jgi:hypothetical protein
MDLALVTRVLLPLAQPQIAAQVPTIRKREKKPEKAAKENRLKCDPCISRVDYSRCGTTYVAGAE